MENPMKITAVHVGKDAVMLYLPTPVQTHYPRLLHALASELQQQTPSIRDAVPSYRSLLIIQENADTAALQHSAQTFCAQYSLTTNSSRQFTIPVCYETEYAPDLAALAQSLHLSEADIIQRHTQQSYDCYAIGFIPGFAFLGWVDASIAAPRLAQPKTVAAGSVGIAGRQTGIYPRQSPGGWQIIGRTPCVLYAPEQNQFGAIECGDRVQFIAIDAAEYRAREGEILCLP